MTLNVLHYFIWKDVWINMAGKQIQQREELWPRHKMSILWAHSLLLDFKEQFTHHHAFLLQTMIVNGN